MSDLVVGDASVDRRVHHPVQHHAELVDPQARLALVLADERLQLVVGRLERLDGAL